MTKPAGRGGGEGGSTGGSGSREESRAHGMLSSGGWAPDQPQVEGQGRGRAGPFLSPCPGGCEGGSHSAQEELPPGTHQTGGLAGPLGAAAGGAGAACPVEGRDSDTASDPRPRPGDRAGRLGPCCRGVLRAGVGPAQVSLPDPLTQAMRPAGDEA